MTAEIDASLERVSVPLEAEACSSQQQPLSSKQLYSELVQMPESWMTAAAFRCQGASLFSSRCRQKLVYMVKQPATACHSEASTCIAAADQEASDTTVPAHSWADSVSVVLMQ